MLLKSKQRLLKLIAPAVSTNALAATSNYFSPYVSDNIHSVTRKKSLISEVYFANKYRACRAFETLGGTRNFVCEDWTGSPRGLVCEEWRCLLRDSQAPFSQAMTRRK